MLIAVREATQGSAAGSSRTLRYSISAKVVPTARLLRVGGWVGENFAVTGR
jgi:hypothetical protein